MSPLITRQKVPPTLYHFISDFIGTLGGWQAQKSLAESAIRLTYPGKGPQRNSPYAKFDLKDKSNHLFIRN